MNSEIKEIKIKDLVLDKKNPRKINADQFEKLCNSLKKDRDFLWSRPVLVNSILENHTEIFYVYGGNQRIRAALKLGWKKIPCSIEYGLSEEQMKERIIKDNKGYGEFDFDMLADGWEMDMLLESGFEEEDFLGKEESEETKQKYKIVLEFEDADSMSEYVQEIKNLSMPCKIKIK